MLADGVGLGRTTREVRRIAIGLAAAQQGLLTLEQVEGQLNRKTAGQGLRQLARQAELLQVVPNVWVHTAAGHLVGWDQALEAQARWMALEPRLTLRERSRRSRIEFEGPVAVIAGRAAFQWYNVSDPGTRSELLVPTVQDLVRSDDEVDVLAERIHPVDVWWDEQFPYARPELLIARAWASTGDVTNVGVAMHELMRVIDMHPPLLEYHLRALSEVDASEGHTWSWDALLAELVEAAGGWRSAPEPAGTLWWPREAHVDRVRALHPHW